MNSPYMGRFRVTQIQHMSHDGLDLVGIDSKEIHATATGVVYYAGWENENDPKQGFGQYVCILSDDDKLFYYFGHLSKILVNPGDRVNITDVIGIEGDTGHSFGSHCHYCIRKTFSYGSEMSTPLLSGIPNECDEYDDGYRPYEPKGETDHPTNPPSKKCVVNEYDLVETDNGEIAGTITIDGKTYGITLNKK